MRRAARAGDDHLEAPVARALGERIKPLRRAMRGYDARLIGDLERLERLGGMLHGLPIGLAAHDNGHGFCFRRQVVLLREGSAGL